MKRTFLLFLLIVVVNSQIHAQDQRIQIDTDFPGGNIISLPCSIEFPYANNSGQQVTPENARSFGNDVAKAITVYLQNLQD